MRFKGKSAQEICEDAVIQAYNDEEETVAPARWIYEEIEHQAWKVREEAVVKAQKIYLEAEG